MDAEKKKVLLVEDENGIRNAVCSALERGGYEVINAQDGQEALDKVEGVDVVVLDVFLPKITGDQFLKTIRGRGNLVPVIVMSAMPTEHAVECLKEFKVVNYVSKPFRVKDLVEKVGKAAHVADDLDMVPKATDKLKGFISRQATYGS
jgi:DNA-binding response OmpR family regulator